MDQKKMKAMLNEIKNMNVKQLENASKDIKELINKIDSLVGEKKND